MNYDMLIWVSRNYYSPDEFYEEARKYGVSRRISSRTIPLNMAKGTKMFFVFESEKDYTMRVTKRQTPPHPKGQKPVKNLYVYGYAPVDKVVYYADGTEDPAFLDKLRKKGVEIIDYHAAVKKTPIRGCGTIKPKATYLTGTEVSGNIIWFDKPILIKDKAWRGWKMLDTKRAEEIVKKGLGLKKPKTQTKKAKRMVK